MSLIRFHSYSENLNNEALEGFGNFKIRKIIRTIKFIDELGLPAEEETVLQGVIDGLIETGRCFVMEINVEKSKAMRISRQQFPVHIIINQKQLENMEYFN